jgi:hypothetical protein
MMAWTSIAFSARAKKTSMIGRDFTIPPSALSPALEPSYTKARSDEMTKDEGIALLTRIHETLSSRLPSFALSLVYEKNMTSIEGQTWLIYIDGWSIDSEEDWQEYKIEHTVLEMEKK